MKKLLVVVGIFSAGSVMASVVKPSDFHGSYTLTAQNHEGRATFAPCPETLVVSTDEEGLKFQGDAGITYLIPTDLLKRGHTEEDEIFSILSVYEHSLVHSIRVASYTARRQYRLMGTVLDMISEFDSEDGQTTIRGTCTFSKIIQ